jgi:serine/threonine protein kinase
VVGTWRWLPEHGFGVATQIDADDAYQPLRVLQRLFIALVLLLTLSAMGMLLFSYRNLVWRQRLNEAELKLKQLGQYTMEEKIGEGGMGVVYRARHALMRRETAVKLLLPDRADPESIRRFEREVRLTCQLAHPNTIQVFDYGHTPEGIFYYAMEYLRGLNLHDLVGRFGPQPEGRVIHILTQICDSLAEAHALGLVHRDIKPANIFLCDRGGVPDCVKVLDFGLVREYRGGDRKESKVRDEKAVEGTPSFMPPEAIKDASRSDPRSDLYAVGALGYYLLTARSVFAAANVAELYQKHLTEAPVPPSRRTTNPVSAELETSLLRCLEKEPSQRPQSAGELRALLLASPRAADWGSRERAAWWRQSHDDEKHHAADGKRQAIEPTDATVRIDFAARTERAE